MLQVTNISFDYVDNALFEGIHFDVLPGKILHLQGENGSGKTTLLKLIAGLLSPSEGDIRFQNKSIYRDVSHYQQQICYIGHKPGISMVLSPFQNCQFDLHHGRRVFNWEESIEHLSLKGLENVSCAQLSMGQRRRVALLRLLMSNAKLWLLDEPFVALDSRAIAFLKQQVRHHLSKDGLVMMTSHQPLPFDAKDCMEYHL